MPVSPHLPSTTFAAHLPTAVEIVQSLLLRHGPLRTQELYYEGLSQYPSPTVFQPLPPQPKRVLLEDGSVKMRFAANVRRNQTPWQPMPSASHPDHPFLSMSNLKHQVLPLLESSGLVRKVAVSVPITAGEDLAEAYAKANKLTRRRQREKAETLGWGIGFRLHKQAKKDWENAVYALEVDKVQPDVTKKVWIWEALNRDGEPLQDAEVVESEYRKWVQSEAAKNDDPKMASSSSSPSSSSSSSSLPLPSPSTTTQTTPEAEWTSQVASCSTDMDKSVSAQELTADHTKPPTSTIFSSIMNDPMVLSRWETARNAEIARRRLIQHKERSIERRREMKKDFLQNQNAVRLEREKNKDPNELTPAKMKAKLEEVARLRFARLRELAANEKNQFWSPKIASAFAASEDRDLGNSQRPSEKLAVRSWQHGGQL